MKKYQIIYADPPWRYNFSKSNSREIENQYPTMSLEDICLLNVPSDDNAILYLWATAPKLLEALQVMKSWGFEYKTHAIWDKEIIGMGYWFRGQHELLLVGVKGKMSPPPQHLRVSSVRRERRTKHSKKPSGVKIMIGEWFPELSKIELFARKDDSKNLFNKNTCDSWDVWGNEVESDIEL